MGLLRRVFDDSPAFGQCSSHENIDGGPDGNLVQIDMGPCEAVRLGGNQPVAYIHIGSQRAEALEVEVYGPASDGTAAGKGDLCLLVLAEQGPQEIVGSPDFLDVFVVDVQRFNGRAVDNDRMGVRPLHPAADSLDGAQHDIDVPDIGEVFNRDRVVGHDRRRQNGQGRILRPANGYFPVQGLTALDYKLFHILFRPQKIFVWNLPEKGIIQCINCRWCCQWILPRRK